MPVTVTFRHLEPTEALKSYVQEKLGKIKKYFPDPIASHAVLSFENNHAHVADVQMTLHNGILLKAMETTEDMYSSIDLVVAKIERQVRKYKERIRDHRPQKGPQSVVRHRVVDSDSMNAETSPSGGVLSPQILREEKYIARPLTVEQAVMQLNLSHEQFLCFHNAVTHEVNVLYLRKDGAYGLIEATNEDSSGAGS